jgi:hypothetical protein
LPLHNRLKCNTKYTVLREKPLNVYN